MVDIGGDPACWAERVCDGCGGFVEPGDDHPCVGADLDRVAAETGFSGVVRVDRAGEMGVAKAYGFAHRGYRLANRVDTQFAIASGTKGLTALAVVSLIEEGQLDWTTTARSLLGADLPLIGDDVTVELLLGHRSGIGDYLDEESNLEMTDYLLPVPAQALASTEDYLQVLTGRPAKFAPGERFGYCNSGYVVLALMAERASGSPFSELVHRRVCVPAGMVSTEFLRSDESAGPAAVGYLAAEGSRTNVFHLPVRGSGDGGIYSTAADIHAFWKALLAGKIVTPDSVATMVCPRSDVPKEAMRYGLGFWLHASQRTIVLEGFDAGVSFRTVHEVVSGTTYTVLANTTSGAWPIARLLEKLLLR